MPTHAALLYARALSEYEIGNSEEGDAFAARLLRGAESSRASDFEFAFMAYGIGTISYITGSTEGLDSPRIAAQKVLDSPSAPPMLTLLARVGLAFLSIIGQDHSDMEKQYQALDKAVIRTLAYVSVDRLMGILATRLGRLDQAVIHFEASLEFVRQIRTSNTIAWTTYEYADALLRRKHPRDRELADSLLDEALLISSELGMKPLLQRVTDLQQRAESIPVRAPAYPDGLTQREVEVLRLVAGGRTDREIAEVLVISIRTVGQHVSHILNKTNSANRAEAASFATRHGLD